MYAVCPPPPLTTPNGRCYPYRYSCSRTITDEQLKNVLSAAFAVTTQQGYTCADVLFSGHTVNITHSLSSSSSLSALN